MKVSNIMILLVKLQELAVLSANPGVGYPSVF